MHIALCDDNVADRKQFERLMKRESDRRAATDGILYVDSFGSPEALLTNPMQYDVFYIDLCHTEGASGADVVSALLKKGVNAPMVLCCSEINYRVLNLPDNCFFLDKPIRVSELSASVDRALEIKHAAKAMIELRVENETRYVTEESIAYAVEAGRSLHIHFTDGSVVSILDNAVNFYDGLDQFESLVALSDKIVINLDQLAQTGLFSATMKDGAKFHISPAISKRLRQVLSER